MSETIEGIATRVFRAEWEKLSQHERQVIDGLLHRISLPRDAGREAVDQRTFGERAADRIAAFGGSWTFIIIFLVGLMSWAFLNTEILGPRAEAFDPYPYVFLNLILSMLAAIQAPIIMMAQNRQADRDRISAEVDHEVNVRAELGVHHVDERLHALESRLEEIVGLLKEREGK